MKTKLIAVVVATMACGQSSTDNVGAAHEALNGDTWTTIVNSTGLGYGARYTSASWNNTNIFVGGYHFRSGGDYAWVFRHFNGTTWTNDDVYQTVAGADATAFGVAYHWKHAHLYAIGTADDATQQQHLLIRTAPSVGTGFTNGLDVTMGTNQFVHIANIVDGSDGVYGFYNTHAGGSSSYTTHIVYNDGTNNTWTTVAPPTGMVVQAMCTSDLGATIVGSVGTGNNSDWVSYYTQDHATWHVLDTITHTSTSHAIPTACGFNGNDMYIAGTFYDTQSHWIVRRGDAYVGDNWTTVDTETMATSDTGPVSISAGGTAGKVYLAGNWSSGDPKYDQRWFWRVRRGSTDGNTWVNSDEFQPSSLWSEVASIVGSPIGTFAVGFSGQNGIVRQLQ